MRAPHMVLIGPQILTWNHLAGQRISQNTNDPGEWKSKKEATLCLKSNVEGVTEPNYATLLVGHHKGVNTERWLSLEAIFYTKQRHKQQKV